MIHSLSDYRPGEDELGAGSPTDSSEPPQALDGPAPDPYLAACPSRVLLARIGEKWCALALVELELGSRRFGELQRRLQGVSQKMLTQTLRNLEQDGLISRTLVCDRPIQVSYALTERGRSLAPILRTLKEWARLNCLAVEHARQADDSALRAAAMAP